MDLNALRSRDLNQLKLLLALLTMRSVTKAAQELDVSQPAVSKTLDRLRRELEDPLLVREGNQMRLTQRAQALLPQVEAALSQAANIFAAQGPFNPATANGRVRIGANDYVQIILGTRLLRQLRERAPRLAAEFRPVGMIQPEQLLAEGLMDMVIGPSGSNLSLRSQFLYREAEIGENTSGVLYALGGAGGGVTLYMDKGDLVYEYNMMIIERYTARSASKLAPGKRRMEVTTQLESSKPLSPAEVVLKVDGQEVARTTVKRTVPAAFSASETFDIGVDLGSTVSLDYFDRRPFRFDGKIEKVEVKLN